MIQVAEHIPKALTEHALRDLPAEACGYLAGKDSVITKHYALRNVDESPEHFTFDVKEQFEVVRKVRDEGLHIMANYHSHPETPARPSQEDIKLAHDPDILYFIISLKNETPDIKAFRIKENQVTPVEIVVRDL